MTKDEIPRKKCDQSTKNRCKKCKGGQTMTKDEIRDRLVEIIQNSVDGCATYWAGRIADGLLAHGVTVQERARPLEEWHEDYGDVLWWKFPIEEPPYVGSPLDEKWYEYHTHWTPISLPQAPKEVE